MGRNRILTLVSLPLLAIPSLAAAQEAVTVEPEVDVLFPTMGPDGTGTSVGGQLMLMTGDGDTLKRIDVSGQVMSESGAGGYLTVGASTVQDDQALGSIEAGAIFHHPTTSGDLAVRAGIILPTGQGDNSEFPLHMISTLFSRPSDFLTGVPDTTSLRLAFTPSVRSSNLIARADVGLDFVIDTDNGSSPDAPFLHVDLGAGYQSGKAAALVEMSSMTYLDETDERYHVIGLTGEIAAGKTTPYLTLSKPFVSGNGSDFEDVDIVNIGVGLRGKI
jgi:hypothetical protein